MDILRLLGCFAVSFSPAFLSTILGLSGNNEWYQTLQKPAFTPEPWVFAPVWTLIYTLMAISLFMFLNTPYDINYKKWGLIFFTLQIILNALYMPVFFGQQSLEGGFVITIFLLIALTFTIIEFYKNSKFSACLLIPYLIWGIFAAVLSYNILKLN